MSAEGRKVPHDGDEAAYARAKIPVIAAASAIVVGLGVSASVHPTVGGVILLAGWALGILALHRLGRIGSRTSAPPR